MTELNTWEKKLEKIQNERAKEISKKSEWARLLGCKPDKKPWTMSFNMFGAANKLISHIERISDQELLALIAREARRLDIKCAAIRNITDQKLLKFFLCSNNQLIREAAITHLEDQKLLEELALDERYNSIAVRRAAIAKLENPAVLQKISGSNAFSSVREAAMLRFVEISDSSEDENTELAISAEWASVRLAAAKKLPAEKTEARILELAAVLSSSPYGEPVFQFQDLCFAMLVENSSLLKKIAAHYPDAYVRSLAEPYKPSKMNLIDSKINSKENKAYFDDGIVYAITGTGEYKIGYYDEKYAYDETKKIIAMFAHDDDGIWIQFNHLGLITYLNKMYGKLAEEASSHEMKEAYQRLAQKDSAKLWAQKPENANASNAGYVEEVDGNYEHVAYLCQRFSNNSKERILGMAAAFVCLQNAFIDENKYSRFYHQTTNS